MASKIKSSKLKTKIILFLKNIKEIELTYNQKTAERGREFIWDKKYLAF